MRSLNPVPALLRLRALLAHRLPGRKPVAPVAPTPSADRVLGPISASLNHANDTLATAFHGLSDTFIPLHERIETLLRHSDELVVLASGRRDGRTLFQEAVQVLHAPLEFVDFCVGSHGRLLQLFARTEEKTGAMLHFQRQMEAMLAPLTYVEVLIKIESASLEEEHRSTFLNVVAEIQRLHRLVSDTFHQNTELLSTTHATLKEVRVRLERDFAHHARSTTERRQQIEGAIVTLDDQLHNNGDRDVKLQVFSHSLSDHVSAIVTAIQSQDIIKQKCDHVLESLAEIAHDRTGEAALLKVQLSQVDGFIAELDAAEARLSHAIGAISEAVEEINRNSLTMDEFTHMTASADGMVQQLLDALSGVTEIIAGTLTLTVEAHEAARPAGNIASNLSNTLGELSINMRLIALNAQVRSLQISQGTGLEILAARTAALSSEISVVSDQVAAHLDELRDDTREMLGLLEDFSTRGKAQHTALVEGAPAVEKRLHQLRDEALTVLAAIGEATQFVHDSSEKTTAHMNEIPACAKAFREARELLAQHIGDLEAAGATELCDRSRARLEEHARRYTMHTERQAHGLAHGAPAASSTAPVAGETEFFDDSFATAAPTNDVGGAPPEDLGEVVGKTPPRAPASASVSAELGKNIDLF